MSQDTEHAYTARVVAKTKEYSDAALACTDLWDTWVATEPSARTADMLWQREMADTHASALLEEVRELLESRYGWGIRCIFIERHRIR